MGRAIDWNRPIQTRDGKPARFVCTRKAVMSKKRVVLIDHGNVEMVCYASEDGLTSTETLINVPQKHVQWLNAHVNADGNVIACAHGCRESADKWAEITLQPRIACVRVEFMEGDGLEPSEEERCGTK